MTDQELIDLVRQKPPDELSSDEISLLRQRMRQSAGLRDALHEQMRLDHCLSAALGHVRVSVDKILAMTGAATVPRPWAGWYGWGACGIVLLVVSTAMLMTQFNQEDAALPDVVALAPPAVDPATPLLPTDGANDSGQPATPAEFDPALANPAAEDDSDDEKWLADGPSPSDALAGRRVEIEAESFQRGNAQVDASEFGAGIGVIKSGQVRPSFVEHEFEAPVPGEYELDIRYAAEEPRPFSVSLAGRTVESDGAETGGSKPDSQRWNSVGTFQLGPGQHVLRIEAAGELPHIDRLALTTSFASGEDGPWTAGLERESDFAASCFDDFDANSPGLPVEELKRWLLPVEWNQDQIKSRPGYAPTVDGLLRLRAPWPNHAALRLSLYELHQFRIHFWRGRLGLTLQYYAYPRPAWVAYATTRGTPKDVRPKSLAMVATDGDRFRRTGQGTFELRYDDGALQMMRGDVRLLTAPLAGAPEEVYLDGHAAVRTVSMSRTTPPPEATLERPVVVKSAHPAKMAWREDLPEGAVLRKLDDGRLELVGKDLQGTALATVPLGEPGLYEVVFQFENPLPGTGIVLADGRGRPIHRIGFFREHHTGWTSLGFLPGDRPELNSVHDAERLPAPFVGKRPWIRLVQGCGTIKCWISGDGEHWSPAFEPLANVGGYEPFTRIGLYALPGAGVRGIRLRSLDVRELSAVTSLASPDWKEPPAAALGRDEAVDLGGWLQAVLESQPAGADAGEWRRTCAVRTLQAGASRNLGNELLLCLLHDGLASNASAAEGLRLLDDVSLLADTWQADIARKLAQELFEQYAWLGSLLADAGQAKPFSSVGRTMFESPIWTDAEIDVLPLELIRRELLDSVQREEWPAVADLSRRAAFWARSCDPQRPAAPRYDGLLRLVAWAESNAARQINENALATAGGRHPLVEELGKEAYNILGEFNAALEGKSYDEACRILSSAQTERALGLLPDARDAQLLVSLAEAVQAAFRQHPDLLRMMQRKFAPAGKVRVKQAAESGDIAAIEAATVQFSGTEAAAEAHLWLGDHALAAGDFVGASREYRQAVVVKSWPGREGGLARLRLTSAMLGRDEGQPPRAAVDFGGQRLTPAQFETLVVEMRDRQRGKGPSGDGRDSNEPAAATVPAAYVSKFWAPFDGPGAAEPPSGGAIVPGRDAVAREIATTVAGGSLLVSNRVQTVSYSLASGQKMWISSADAPQGLPQSWLRSPMSPIVAGTKVYVRRLSADGPSICCLAVQNGQLLWSSRQGLVAVSDPLLTQGQLLCLTAEVEHDRSLRLFLTTLDMETGDVVTQRPLTQVRDMWNRQITCRLMVHRDQLLATFAGCVLCTDMLGSPRWLRRQAFVPPAQDAHFAEQDHDAPLIDGRQLIVSQPGVRAVEALDIATGRLIWRASLPRSQGVLGLADQTIVVRTATGLEGLSSLDGRVHSRAPIADLLEASLVSSGRLLIARRERLAGGKQRPVLVWLDPASGAELGASPIDELVDDLPALGPLVRQGERTWAFVGRGEAQASRELVELEAQGDATPPVAPTISLVGWTVPRQTDWQASVNTILPGWALISCQAGDQAGPCLEQAGQRQLFSTRPPGGFPARFARWVSVPAGQSTRLRVQVGHDAQHPWRLEVRAVGRSLAVETVSPQTAAGGWRELEIDLSSLAGKSFWLTVSQHPEGDPQAPAYWKRLELASSGP